MAYADAGPKAPEPPYNLSCEAAILGSVLYDNLAFDTVRDYIQSPDDFYAPAHQSVWAAIADLIPSGRVADGRTLLAFFESEDRLTEIGGGQYLAELLDSACFGPEIGDYSRIVQDLAIRRRAISVCGLLNDRVVTLDREHDARDIVNDTIQELEDCLGQSFTESRWESAATAVADELAALEAQMQHGRPVGLSTGLSTLDEFIGGLHRGDLYVLGGASSMGKTALAVNICLGTAKTEGAKVAFFSQEMTRAQLAWRMAAREARCTGKGKVEYQALRNGYLGQHEYAVLKAGLETVPKSLFWNCARGLTLQDIRSALRRAKRQLGGLDVVCIDYLQIMSIASGRDKTRALAIGEVTMALKKLAGDEDCAVMVLSQLSRKINDRDNKRPTLSDLRESGSIEQDADTVLFAYRDDYYKAREEPGHIGTSAWTEWKIDYDAVKGKFEVIVGKQRMGPVGTVHLHFEKETDAIVENERFLEEGDLL